jgi:hypothetical protein
VFVYSRVARCLDDQGGGGRFIWVGVRVYVDRMGLGIVVSCCSINE